ncbi:accessory factor UbiK family protein [Cardiobacteriaceae bacterium TAE3-ERU3]|nr:accessory factor UbiK family protein [Cardiobacteriaceae bacterium TAE3-ERU3]
MKKNPFAFIASQIEANLPESIRPMTDEAKQMVRGVISEKLAQFDLVPREEFAQQERLLARAEKRVAELEARVTELENQRSGTTPSSASIAAIEDDNTLPPSSSDKTHGK